jgi:ABC-type uncharacterized transport system YnjBCD permease subunit
MDISLPGWLGAIAGIVLAAILYVAALGTIEKELQQFENPHNAEERAALARRRAAMRKGILAILVTIGAVIGYWLGETAGHLGSGSPHTGTQL